MMWTLIQLTEQMLKLTEKLTDIQEQQRNIVDLERLARAEASAEALRGQLRDVQSKEIDFQLRADQIEFDLRPEIIERSVGGFGTLRPEEAREARRRSLESERTKIRAQLELLRESHLRLESSIALADAEAQKIRFKIESNPDRDAIGYTNKPPEKKLPSLPQKPPTEKPPLD